MGELFSAHICSDKPLTKFFQCGEGVPERTKGYFGSHLSAVQKLLHVLYSLLNPRIALSRLIKVQGYHVQITARSDRDLTPESIMQKVGDASGSKYSGGGNIPSASGPKPPVSSKPVFTPTAIAGSGSSFNPLGSRSRAAPRQEETDEDGWGADAPPVTRTQLEKVAPAYQPTKVNISQLTSQKQESSRFTPSQPSNGDPDLVRGGYQPIGKVDIAEIRRQAKEAGELKDERPTTVKGSYEPVGKVDIAAIRARAQGPGGAASPPSTISPAATGEDEDRPRPLADRSAAFQQSERLTALPKPKVANKFGGSSFTGTKAPTPGDITAKPAAPAPPVGLASRTFADQGGKTPAQVWAEKKGRERGPSITSPGAAPTSPLQAQTSGGWSSGYAGKKWNPVDTMHTGRSSLGSQHTGQDDQQPEEPTSPSGGVASIRDRFSGRAVMGQPAEDSGPPPQIDLGSKPSGGARGIPIPGLPTHSYADQVPAEEHVDLPPPPRRPEPEEEEEEEQPDIRPSSPIRVAMPVSRKEQPELSPAEEQFSPPTLPMSSVAQAASRARDVPPAPQVHDEEPARGAASGGGKRALVQYDYEKAEDNEIELREGDYVSNIDMVDDDWWMGTNEQGETGLFPSNYVELVEDAPGGGGPAAADPEPEPEPEPVAAAAAGGTGRTATAQYDYEAAEDNELSFPDGATIINVVSTSSSTHVYLTRKGFRLIYDRSSPMTIGGSVNMRDDRDCFRRIMCSSTSRSDAWIGEREQDTCV